MQIGMLFNACGVVLMFQIQNIAFAAQCEGKGSCSTVPNQAMTGNSMLQKTQKASRKAPFQRKESTTWYLGLVKNAEKSLTSCDKACNGVETETDVSSCYCHEIDSVSPCDGKSENEECTYVAKTPRDTSVGAGPYERQITITNKCVKTSSGGLWCPPTGKPATVLGSDGNYDGSGLSTDLPGIEMSPCGAAHCQEEGQSCAFTTGAGTSSSLSGFPVGGTQKILISESKCSHWDANFQEDPDNWYCPYPAILKLLGIWE